MTQANQFGISGNNSGSPRQSRYPAPLQLTKPSVRKYEISHTLGTGTYGQVYRCHVTSDKGRMTYAVKIANKEAAYRRSAINESKVLQLLINNKETVRWIDTYEENGHICIVTEILSKTIYDVMKERKFQAMSIAEVKSVALNICKSTSALHRVGYMHCDIKPENIMLRSLDDGVRSSCLIDFGAVRQLSENAYFDIQSLWYRAPEVLCNVPYTPKIDAWSLGCLLYEIATGTPLFPGNSSHDEIARIIDVLGSPSIEACSRVQGLTLAYSPGPSSRATKVIDESVYQIHGRTPTSEAFIHLLYGLLNPDEALRVSCEGALAHPFLSESQNMSPSGSFSQYPQTMNLNGSSSPHRVPQLSQYCLPSTPVIGTPNASNTSLGPRFSNIQTALGSSGTWATTANTSTPHVINTGFGQISPLIAPQSVQPLPPVSTPCYEQPALSSSSIASGMGSGFTFPSLCPPIQSTHINFMRHSPNQQYPPQQSLILQQIQYPSLQQW
eukprot:GILJ01014893.1.p1 GENE.GILJ01014893.1~~GILJ01014893.1.p1  ORF type:complete len:498 (+),score=35.07 GILJ01014893.1:71-1564(+)